jgi:hypothetical protein
MALTPLSRWPLPPRSCIHLPISRSRIVHHGVRATLFILIGPTYARALAPCGRAASFRRADAQTTLGSVSSARLPFWVLRVLCICAEAASTRLAPFAPLPPRPRRDAIAVEAAQVALLILMREWEQWDAFMSEAATTTTSPHSRISRATSWISCTCR